MEALGWLQRLSNSDKHRVTPFSFTGLSQVATPDVGVSAFANARILFGTDEGHLGLTGVQAIAVTVESAIHELEHECPELSAS